MINIVKLEDALNKRNEDNTFAEDNNRQLLNLLEKYDNKLDQMQEDLEIRDLKIMHYEHSMEESEQIKTNTLDDKIHFILQMLDKL